ncbi:MAG: GDSL-type esterase/lipase family protein [Muricomes sp.]
MNYKYSTKYTNKKDLKTDEKKGKRRLIIYCCAAVIILVAGILTAEVMSNLTSKKVETAQGLKILKKAESADAKKIEEKMDKLAEKELEANKKAGAEKNYKAIFADSVVMGDSISEALIEYDFLNASSVVAKIGVEIDSLDDQLESVEEINPQVVFLAYGANDIPATKGDADVFIKKYDTLIQNLQKRLPDTKIFVNSIFPVQKQEIEREPSYKKLDDYNEALRTMCDKKQITFIDNTKLVSDSYYEDDGIHFKEAFYPHWLARMAEVASL